MDPKLVIEWIIQAYDLVVKCFVFAVCRAPPHFGSINLHSLTRSII
jgi:hypothetical protein